MQFFVKMLSDWVDVVAEKMKFFFVMMKENVWVKKALIGVLMGVQMFGGVVMSNELSEE